MPWSVSDVESHKKGLSEKGKKQWCRVANSVLKRLMEKGMSEKEAAASAIKQANGVVMNTNSGSYSIYKNKQKLDYEINFVVHQEKAHIIIPVVMMVEGVHHGNQGAIYHSIDELGKVPASWNGIPVVINHPEEEGVAISANSPEIIDSITVGRVYNTIVDDNKLKAEVWIDEDKLNTVCPKVLDNINDTKEVEVSLGMFTDNEESEGDWNGEKYVKIAKNHRPDHLAILPDEIGACSCADGCGLGANSKIKNMAKLNDVEKTIKQLNSEGYSINQILSNSEQGYQEKMQMVNDTLRKLDKSSSKDGVYVYNYLEEMFDDSLVYRSSSDGSSKLYKQDYEIKNGILTLTGTAKLVQKKVDYVNVNKDIQSSLKGDAGVEVSKTITKNKEVNKMSNETKCPRCLEKINALIANEQSKFVETDREWLLTQDEGTLDKLAPVVKEIEKIVEKTVEVNKLSAEDQADLAWAKKMRKEKRDSIIKGIQDNTEKGTWDDATLSAMTEDVLERVLKSVKKDVVVDYSVNANVQSNTGGIEPLYPVGVEIKK